MDLPHQILASLSAQSPSIPTPTLAWVTSLLAGRPNPPALASLVATARTRLLAADLALPGMVDARWAAQHALLPRHLPSPAPTAGVGGGAAGGGGCGAGAGAVEAREVPLGRDVVVQVLDVEDVSRSRWEQVEELEAVARGERTRGREIVRVRDEDDDDEGDEQQGQQHPPQQQQQQQQQQQPAVRAGGTHKLLLQDSLGQRIYGLELRSMERLALGRVHIGEKLLLRATATVARGVVLLEPATCLVLGGKVEAWHRAWVEGRLARLRVAVGADAEEGQGGQGGASGRGGGR